MAEILIFTFSRATGSMGGKKLFRYKFQTQVTPCQFNYNKIPVLNQHNALKAIKNQIISMNLP